MLHLKGVPYENVEEPIRKWTDWLREWGERTGERLRVPVLRIIENEKEEIYTESNNINLMLDERFGEVAFTPVKDSPEYKEMEEWFLWCDKILKPQIDLYKYGENLKFDKVAHVGHTEKLREMLGHLESSLVNKKYLLDERLTLADIAIIPFIRQIMRTREGEFDFTDFPNVKRWTLSLIETGWFTDIVMKKLQLQK